MAEESPQQALTRLRAKAAGRPSVTPNEWLQMTPQQRWSYLQAPPAPTYLRSEVDAAKREGRKPVPHRPQPMTFKFGLK